MDSVAGAEASNSSSKVYSFDIEKIHAFIDENLESALKDAENETAVHTFSSKSVFWTKELLVIPFAPKYPLSHFCRNGCKIFLSKKKPLLICAELANQQETEEALQVQENFKILKMNG